MFDTAQNDQFPAGAAAYAGYVDGGIGNQPNYAFIASAFPKAQHLSIALFPGDNADALPRTCRSPSYAWRSSTRRGTSTRT